MENTAHTTDETVGSQEVPTGVAPSGAAEPPSAGEGSDRRGLPTMADLSTLSAELDQIDATLARLDRTGADESSV